MVPKTSRSLSRAGDLAALGVVLVAFALRVLALGGPSLWYDEGFAVQTARLPIPALVERLIREDNHSPLHYLVLHVWMLVAGDSETALRFSSVVVGVLIVALTYAIFREVFRGRPGEDSAALIAGAPSAALVALSPFLVYYAREARMYSLLACFTLAAAWTLLAATRRTLEAEDEKQRRDAETQREEDVRALEHQSHGREIASPSLAMTSPPQRLRAFAFQNGLWVAHGVLLAGMLYTQYMGVFFIPAFALFALLSGWRVFVRWLLAAAVGALLFLPWLPFALLQMRRLFGSTPEYFPAYLDASAVIQNGLRSFLALDVATWAGAAAVLLLLGSAALLIRDARRDATLARREALPMLATWLPLLLIAVASSSIAKFVARYAIPAAPMLYLSIALVLFGLLWRKAIIARAVYAVALVALLVFLGRGGWSATIAPWVPHEDARGIADYLNERARPEQDIIFMDARPDAFDYYYHGQAAVHPMFVGFDYEAGASQLNAILARKPERIWLILWQHEAADPTGMVIDELQRRSGQGRVTRSNYREYTLLRFDLADWSPVEPMPTPQQSIGATFGDRLTLVGADRLKGDPGVLRWILYWQAREPLAGDIAVTLQLKDAEGKVRVSHNQGPSAPWLAAAGLPTDVTVRGLTEVTLPKDLAPGTYEASVLVWDPSVERNLAAAAADGTPRGTSISLGTVEVTPAMLAK
ncbi:MAG: glycosyltransferase family 39 protein [Anaerolineae bacterium]